MLSDDGGEPEDTGRNSRPRLLLQLAKQAGWTESLTDEDRQAITAGIRRDLLQPGLKPRDRKRLMDTILRMEAADVSRGRLLMDAGKQASPDAATAETLLADLEEIRKRRGDGPT